MSVVQPKMNLTDEQFEAVKTAFASLDALIAEANKAQRRLRRNERIRELAPYAAAGGAIGAAIAHKILSK